LSIRSSDSSISVDGDPLPNSAIELRCYSIAIAETLGDLTRKSRESIFRESESMLHRQAEIGDALPADDETPAFLVKKNEG